MDEFMKDRYGADQLTTVLGIAGMVVAAIGMVANATLAIIVGVAAVAVALARALSKDVEARRREDEAWRGLVAKVPGIGSGAAAGKGADLKRQARTAKKMWRDRKVKAFLKCPTCGTTLAVPRGKGKLIVTCPKCRTRMETRS